MTTTRKPTHPLLVVVGLEAFAKRGLRHLLVLDRHLLVRKLVCMTGWTFADNLRFVRTYDLAYAVRSSTDPEATLATMERPLPIRPGPNDPWLLYRLRRCWDHLATDRVIMTLQATRRAYIEQKAFPKEAWLIIGLASLPDDEWIPPQDYWDLIDEVTISVDGDQDFKDELTRWICNPKRLPTIKRVLRWIPWA